MRIGIITDIHENTATLTEALRLASLNKCDEIACLGDIVGFEYPDFTGSTTQYVERNNHLTSLWGFMELNNATYSFSGHSHSHFAGLAYRGGRSFFKAIHSVPCQTLNLGKEMVMISLPPLAGEKGRTGFSIIDSDNLKLEIIAINMV
ncbi:MAG: metallophosphatase family protein [Bacteroidales bacterium]|nr:metallophosphatase family protein [Bacteroidales bacterium]